MKETFYFPHDNNAHNDPKLMTVFMETGLCGIGLYWILIELLHQQEDGRITYKQYEYYVRWFSSHERRGEAIVEQMLNIYLTTELFCRTEDDFIISKRVLNNKIHRENLSEKRSLAGKASALARQQSTNVEQNGTNVEQGKERKGKERKGNIDISNEIFIPEFSSEFQKKYQEWLDDRKARKKKVTDRAKELQLKKCREMGEANAIIAIDNSIEKGYQGIFLPTNFSQKTKQTPELLSGKQNSNTDYFS